MKRESIKVRKFPFCILDKRGNEKKYVWNVGFTNNREWATIRDVTFSFYDNDTLEVTGYYIKPTSDGNVKPFYCHVNGYIHVLISE